MAVTSKTRLLLSAAAMLTWTGAVAVSAHNPSVDTPRASVQAAPAAKSGSDTKQVISELKAALDHRVIELPNGMEVVLHRDTSAPEVHFYTMFRVGSKDEPEGKTGFAHLFEHLLFNGTKNNPEDFFSYVEEIGGSSKNASTSFDKTDYYQTVPKGAMERMLWLEMDRFLNGGATITPENLAKEIEVVKNEMRNSTSAPFGGFVEQSLDALVGDDHPYGHDVIGLIEDLEGSSIEDIKRWYEQFYGARNGVLALVGDFEYDEAEALVRKYYVLWPTASRSKAWPYVANACTQAL